MFLDKIAYTNKDIRYTKKGKNIYAIVLGWPGDNTGILLKSFAENAGYAIPEISTITMLGSKEPIKYELTKDGLKLTTPSKGVDSKAVVFKITTK